MVEDILFVANEAVYGKEKRCMHRVNGIIVGVLYIYIDIYMYIIYVYIAWCCNDGNREIGMGYANVYLPPPAQMWQHW